MYHDLFRARKDLYHISDTLGTFLLIPHFKSLIVLCFELIAIQETKRDILSKQTFAFFSFREMGSGASTAALSAKQIKDLAKQFNLEPEKIQKYFVHYVSLVQGDIDTSLNKWILEKLFTQLVPDTTFTQYLLKMQEWNRKSIDDRLFEYFQLLDYNQDDLLTPSDISIYLSQVNKQKLELQQRVRIRNESRSGILKYIGPVEFQTGIWCGIHLDTPTGKNNGTVQEKSYFDCPDNHGVFIPFYGVETEVLYNQAKQMLDQFGPVVDFETFKQTCKKDVWLLKRLEL